MKISHLIPLIRKICQPKHDLIFKLGKFDSIYYEIKKCTLFAVNRLELND